MVLIDGLTSASGLLALLDEESDEIKVYALDKLNQVVDEFWAEISDPVEKIMDLSENPDFQNRELAALVASKVFYHLGDFHLSMDYALGAGPLFDVSKKSEYHETLIAKFIDKYIELRVKQVESKEQVLIDSRLESIVMQMFDRSFKDGEFKQALGIGIESRRLDKFNESILLSGDVPGMLGYALDVCQSITSKNFRQTVFRTIVELYRTLVNPDYVMICQILIFLDDAQGVSDILLNLIKGDEDQQLLAFQIAFDLYSNGTQHFLAEVRNLLPATKKEEKKETEKKEEKKEETEKKEEKT